MAGELVERPERVQAAFDVSRGKLDTGPNATAIFLYIEALERENATLRAERATLVEKAALIAEEQAERARAMAAHAKESPFHQESVHGAYFLTMAGTGRAIAAAIRNMGGEG